MLRNTSTLQYVVNERLAKRSGLIGNIFKKLEIGQRQYSGHTFGKAIKLANWYWMVSNSAFANVRGVGSRLFIGT